MEHRDRPDDPVELFGLCHLGPGSRLHPSDIEDVRALFYELLRPRRAIVELVGGTTVVEGVGGPVQDPHDQRSQREIEGPLSEDEHGAGRASTGPPGQNNRAASALRYCVVRGSSAPRVSSRSTNSCRASSSVFTRSSSPSSRASIPSLGTSTCCSANLASAANWRISGRLRDAGEQLQGLGGFTRRDEEPGETCDRNGMVGLELEQPF